MLRNQGQVSFLLFFVFRTKKRGRNFLCTLGKEFLIGSCRQFQCAARLKTVNQKVNWKNQSSRVGMSYMRYLTARRSRDHEF